MAIIGGAGSSAPTSNKVKFPYPADDAEYVYVAQPAAAIN